MNDLSQNTKTITITFIQHPHLKTSIKNKKSQQKLLNSLKCAVQSRSKQENLYSLCFNMQQIICIPIWKLYLTK